MPMKFEESLAGGPHALLAAICGDWQGLARTWFEPGEPVDTSPIQGTIGLALGGRFAVHEYKYKFQDKANEAIALIGYNLQLQRWVTAWADSMHNGTAIMFSQGEPGAASASVLGSYPDGQGGPDWGWRTEIALPEPDRLVITHYNIQPGEPEQKAVEIDYQRA
jgi:hypothetical protein